ncbi:MAG: hypothetical protein RR394_09210 [Oscillospiraceae bacterium]
MKVGDTVNAFYPSFGVDYKISNVPETMPAKVVYIHPKRRFFVLEFQFENRSFRQSFNFAYRRGE